MPTDPGPTFTRSDALTTKHDMLLETATRRDEAEALLRVLMEARESSERNLASIGQPDLVKEVTGRSSIDNAIASTKRLIESFNRVLADLRDGLEPEDAELLAEIRAQNGTQNGAVPG